MSFSWFKKAPVIHRNTGNHIMFLHTRCDSQYEDFYLADIIFSLIKMCRIVTICTTEVNLSSPLNHIEASTNKLRFIRFWGGPTLPSCVAQNACINQARMMCLIFRVMLRPPSPRPSLIITDTDSFAMRLLKRFSTYQVIQIEHFSSLYKGEIFGPHMKVNLKYSIERSLRQADEIVVQTECLKEVMESSVIGVRNKNTVLHPRCNWGFWSYPIYNIKTLVPTLPDNFILFAVFAQFKPRGHFELILDALKYYAYYNKDEIILRTRVVFAGFYDKLNDSESTYFNALVSQVKLSPYASNIVFLERTNVPQQKTIIYNCTAILNPTHYNVYPGVILTAMNLKIPIVSVNSGFAATVLENNVSGFLVDRIVDHEATDFAQKMSELAGNSRVAELVVEYAKSEFDEKYSCFAHRLHVNSIITGQMNCRH